MTPAEADTLIAGDEIYHGAHRGVVIGVTREEVTIRWDPLKLTGCSNTTYAKSCQLSGMKLGPRQRSLNAPFGVDAEKQFTELLQKTLRKLGADPGKLTNSWSPTRRRSLRPRMRDG